MDNEIDKVFILGAGFSKAFTPSIPGLADILNEVKDRSDTKISDKLTKLEQKLNSSLGDNTENIISYILSKEIFKSYKEKIEFNLIKNELLKEIYKEINQFSPENHIEKLKDFLKYCAENDYKIITFNYDLFLEKIIKDINEDSSSFNIIKNYGIRINENPYKNNSTIDGGRFNDKELEILKLHGSFNWFSLNNNLDIDYNEVVYCNFFDNNSEGHKFLSEIPVYIPMSFSKYKQLSGNFYKLLWKKAINYLDNANEINFIGYGFPQTDFDNLVMFCDYKDKIENIIVHDSTPENNERIKNIFTAEKVKDIGTVKYLDNLLDN